MEKSNWEYIEDRVNEGIHKSLTYDEWLKNAPDPSEIERDLKVYQTFRTLGLREYLKKEKRKFPLFTFISKNKKALRIAAGISVFLAAGFLVWNISRNDQPGIAEVKTDEDSTAYSEAPPIPTAGISLDDLLANNMILPIENAPQKFESAVDKINKNQAQRGIRELQVLNRAVISNNEQDVPLFGASGEESVEPEGLSREEKVYQNLYLGIAYLKSKDYKKALSHLEKAKDNKEARWYLALTYLGQKDVPGAIKQALDVAEDKNNPFNEQAGQLVEQLEKYEK